MQRQRIVHPATHPRHMGWAIRAVVSGFLASVAALLVLIAAYGFASAVGSNSHHATTLANWAYALTNNKVTELVTTIHGVQAVGLHLVVGLVWAVIYAAVVEPSVDAPGWLKGLFFASIPCLISLLIFLPIVGAGVFGMAVGAGPLAGLGVVLLHAVYGLGLGETYALADGEGVTGGVDSMQAKTLTFIERDVAVGLVLGAIIGAVISLILAAVGIVPAGSDGILLTAGGGATEGAIAGVVVGIAVGIITS